MRRWHFASVSLAVTSNDLLKSTLAIKTQIEQRPTQTCKSYQPATVLRRRRNKCHSLVIFMVCLKLYGEIEGPHRRNNKVCDKNKMVTDDEYLVQQWKARILASNR